MTIAEAKNLCIDDLLGQLGHQPIRQTERGNWYIRPYGQEHHASFHTSPDGRAWYDFGEGIGGNIIDLAMRYASCQNVSSALAWIRDTTGLIGHAIPVSGQRSAVVIQPAYLVEHTRLLADSRGETWLLSRGLDLEACRPYLADIYYNRTKKPVAKPLYAVGLPNYAGGYEGRTQFTGGAWVKTSIGPKSFTVFESGRPNAPWFQFEGLPDFGTFLTLRRPKVNDVNLLIMNGTGMTGAAIAYLETKPAGVLTLCPQHGSQGSMASCEAFRQFVTDHGWAGGEVAYPKAFEDYNSWHMSVKGIGGGQGGQDAKAGLEQTPSLRSQP